MHAECGTDQRRTCAERDCRPCGGAGAGEGGGYSEPVRAAILEAVQGLAEVEFTLDLAFIRLKAVEGLPTMVAKFATDIPQLTQLGRTVAAGTGIDPLAHTPDEKLSKKEMLEAVELYIKVAKQLLIGLRIPWIATGSERGLVRTARLSFGEDQARTPRKWPRAL